MSASSAANVTGWLPPIDDQDVWAAGVTYFRSRTARMEESKDAGGGSFYDRVYAAERPEIFFKATPLQSLAPPLLQPPASKLHVHAHTHKHPR